MTGLQITWTIVFAAAVLLFLAVEVVVGVGAARELKYMGPSRLREPAHQDGPEQPER